MSCFFAYQSIHPFIGRKKTEENLYNIVSMCFETGEMLDPECAQVTSSNSQIQSKEPLKVFYLFTTFQLDSFLHL